jgi:hypothetical protein
MIRYVKTCQLNTSNKGNIGSTRKDMALLPANMAKVVKC